MSATRSTWSCGCRPTSRPDPGEIHSPPVPEAGPCSSAGQVPVTRRTAMSRVIVIEFVTLDGVVQDPDGSQGFEQGGWIFRYGPEAVAGDRFNLGELLDTGTLLLGRHTWELFTKIWPGRGDDFSAKMNAVPKLVVSRSADQVTGWQNSTVLEQDLATAVRERKQVQDVMVMGSISVVRALMADDLVDEY